MSLGFSADRFLRLSLPNDFFCKICKKVLNNPVQCLNCKFFICLSCTPSACGLFPADRHIYTEVDIKLRNKIKEFEIKCKFYQQGCLKIDKVDNIEHHESTCQYAKLICEHIGNSCSSQFKSQNCCPHTLMICPDCKKQMKSEEKKNHNCVEWLLSQIKLKENQNNDLISRNQQLLLEQNQSKNNHAAFVVESSNQIKQADLENEEIIAEIQLLSTRLREKKEFLERSVQNRYFEYNEYCNNKFETCLDKNKEELKILERTLNKSLDRYLDNSAKRLFEFNAAVQADSKDLSTIPLDMKEYDQNPLKTVVYIPKGINSVHI